MDGVMSELWERLRNSCLFWVVVTVCALWFFTHNASALYRFSKTLYNTYLFHYIIDGIAIIAGFIGVMICRFFSQAIEGLKYILG